MISDMKSFIGISGRAPSHPPFVTPFLHHRGINFTVKHLLHQSSGNGSSTVGLHLARNSYDDDLSEYELKITAASPRREASGILGHEGLIYGARS